MIIEKKLNKIEVWKKVDLRPSAIAKCRAISIDSQKIKMALKLGFGVARARIARIAISGRANFILPIINVMELSKEVMSPM
jgi:hypothetical protein